MTSTAIAAFVPPLQGPLDGQFRRRAAPAKSLVHRAALVLVFIAVASSSLVFTEPAPVDAINMALIVGLPLVGLVAWRRMLAGYLSLWLLIAAAGFLAAIMAIDTPRATMHFAISLYLYLSAFVFGSFVARNPSAHGRLILDAYLVAALIAAVAGIAGYFDLVPGTSELFTRYSRASGTFKDPNVFGAFLVPALVYTIHRWLERPLARTIPMGLAGGIIALGILVSFSRGAWAITALAIAGYAYLALATARTAQHRLQLVGLSLLAAVALTAMLMVAIENDNVAQLLAERATLSQTYDEGAEGRFGGQLRALEVIVESPFGIGALEFTPGFHVNGMMMPNHSDGRGFGDDPHNSYISMFLNAGWLAGVLNIVIVVLTLTLGLRHALRRTPSQPLFLVAYVSVAALFALGAIIDIDHWRHLHLLLGLLWGMMAAGEAVARAPRIVADVRPVLLRRVLIIPPSQRRKRIVRELAGRPALKGFPGAHRAVAQRRRPPRLASRH